MDMGLINTLIVLLGYILYQGSQILSNVWLSKWTSDPILTNSSYPTNSTEFVNKQDTYLGVYGAIGIGIGE